MRADDGPGAAAAAAALAEEFALTAMIAQESTANLEMRIIFNEKAMGGRTKDVVNDEFYALYCAGYPRL